MTVPLSLLPSAVPQFLAVGSKPSARPAGPEGSAWDDATAAIADDECGLVIDYGSGIAVQPVYGYIAAGCSSEEEAFCACFDALRIIATCDTVAADPGIRALVMHICSPGGSVVAASEICSSLVALQEARPDMAVLAYIDGCGCSMAARIAAACSETHATAGSSVGSIGTILVNYDSAVAFASAGIKVTAFTDGVYKGMGQPGVALTEAQAEYLDAMVKSYGAEFKTFMRERRGLDDSDMEGQPFIASAGHYPEKLLDSCDGKGIDCFLLSVAQQIKASNTLLARLSSDETERAVFC